MNPAQIDMEKTCQIFLKEMERGLAAEQSSLAMLPTYIEIERQIPLNKPVIVMDAGGTNFRVATVSFDQDGKSNIENFKLFPMPGVKQQVSKDEFFNIMAGYLDEIIDKSANIGFCFSYPIEIFPNKDGKVLYFSKEIKADEVAGNMIGQNLNAAISSSGNADKKHIILLNDTVATLLAGRADVKGISFDTYIGFILGTGTNCSYIDLNKNITKAKDLDLTKSQIINVESGGFGKAPQGKIDKDFDQSSNCPGMYTFEKMISGAYLGPLCLWTVRTAAKDGLLSKDSSENVKKIKELSTKDVNDFMSYPQGKGGPLSSALKTASQEDLATAYYLIDRLIERAAKLTAINLSAAAIKSGKGHNPCRPVCIVAEGTTFYQLKSLKQRVEYYLKDYLVNENGVFYEIINVENATLIGAAIAGLTN
ncbi:MAG: hexokinase [Planctomycetes bacterium]|nr:hexokinase [Planctomycetota bacterium]